MNHKPKTQTGFTIIEVMIVLAVGGLIFLLIFNAIPTLQQASRNNQRKQDITILLAAVSRYQLNNGAEFPTAARNALDPSVPASFFLGSEKLSFYTYEPSIMNVQAIGSPAATFPAITSFDEVEVYNYAKCTTTGGATSSAADYRDVVTLYAIENRDRAISKCQQL